MTRTASVTVTENVVSCNDAPVINIQQPLTFEANTLGGWDFSAFSLIDTATDTEDVTPEVVCSPAVGSVLSVGNNIINCTATDSGGLTATATGTIAVTDTTVPTILGMPTDITEEATGPSGAVATWDSPTATDIVDGSVSVSCSPASGSTFELGTTTVTCSATDNADNSASDSFTVTVEDTTPPVITWIGSISDGDSFLFGSVLASPTCTASDTVSGTVFCNVSGYSAAVGSHTLTATATDNAGNTATEPPRAYTVAAWTLHGFYQPVAMGTDAYSTVKGGSTVPLKFEVFAGSTELTSTSVVSSFKTTKITCENSMPEDAVDVVTTGGTSLRYDTTSGQFIQNWQTPKQAGACYRVTMTTQDGSSLIALFKLK